ncbi:glycoside hydrolase family 16 protein [Auriscalpium vulgare]|uniref:Glycoside hydrolase family 16 protein n=1 Tax=Auriscalpium vulgare TaxID=40419 RepID=A0ACB8S8K1_9AGAM|nr:glycoside hydrolase family 16 protein [Auriscalpium vulgare]
MLAPSILVVTLLSGQALAATYSVVDTYQGSNFFDNFVFETFDDPTHGRVNYVDMSTAQSKGYATVSGNNFTLRADHTTVLGTGGRGRDSFRIQSKKSYDHHVSVYNVAHMPHGCGTWPAIWEKGDPWPTKGEVDILEGVNDVAPNQSTLHTSPDCTMPSSRTESGTPTSNDCNTAANSNSGCGVKHNDANSYGPDFNSNGGGWLAMERTSSFIRIWFWQRDDANVPTDVKNGSGSINTDDWHTPDAYFPNTSCDIASHFSDNNIVINLTFCGDWAGSAYGSSGCPGSCVDFVNNNPSAFLNAHFTFIWIKVYT